MDLMKLKTNLIVICNEYIYYFSSKPKSKKILAYCHSQTHEEIDTCDLNGIYKQDIKVDLLTTDDIKQYNRYDIIYLVNCPSSVYIKERNFNEIYY
jgi:hypothetical protein